MTTTSTDKSQFVSQAPKPKDPFHPRTAEQDLFPCGKNEPSIGSTETIPEGKAKAR